MPEALTRELRERIINRISDALDHELVLEVMEEYAGNMGFKLQRLPQYGLRKVARYAATVAVADALGIPIGAFRCTDEELAQYHVALAKAFAEAGKPVIVVAAEPEAQDA